MENVSGSESGSSKSVRAGSIKPDLVAGQSFTPADGAIQNEAIPNEPGSSGPHEGQAVNGHAAHGQPATSDQTNSSQATPRLDFTVVKRSGMLVPFSKDRIFGAIEAAFRAAHQIPESSPLSPEVFSRVLEVTSAVVEECQRQAAVGQCLTVEGVQDVVEIKLMEYQHTDIAKNYILYRAEHKRLREDSPRNLQIIRRDGKVVRFMPLKIASAIERAFRAIEHVEGQTPREIVSAVNLLTNKVVGRAQLLARAGTELTVELIQDEIERQMMAEQFYEVAKGFILYRAARAQARALEQTEAGKVDEQIDAAEAPDQIALGIEDSGRQFTVTRDDGSIDTITELTIRKRIEFASCGFEHVVDVAELVEASLSNFYEGIRIAEVDKANILSAKAKIERDPAYSYVAARLFLDLIYRETFDTEANDSDAGEKHAAHFKHYIERGIEYGRLDPVLREFDLDVLARALDLDRDLQFTVLGVQTLYDRYLIHHEDVRLETPQIFWMRVAMGLAQIEGKDKETRAIEFYNTLSTFRFVSSTPTLFNAGTLHQQLSSCYLSTVMDDLSHIFKVISDDAQLSKWAGGLGNDWTNVRATGSRIKGTNGKSQGVIPFLKVANDTAVAVNQGGKRKGAMCAYLETWHLDIEDFLELRKNTGDERRRTHDMNTANWIPDLFMKRVVDNGSWTLFSPADVPDLHDLYGSAFEQRYCEYEAMAENGELVLHKKVEAVQLWRKMLGMLFETGHPWITFKDPSNIRSPQDHVGVVHSSNLCTEILLNTSADETAVCNLGSVNIAAHTSVEGLDLAKLEETVTTAIRMLDNVIDINYYPTAEARNSNLRHRPVGLGLMGFQDGLYIQRIPLGSHHAVEFADESMEYISYYAILASTKLAKERGTYESYSGSKWERGMLPVDSLELLATERGGEAGQGSEYLDVDGTVRADWQVVRDAIKRYGMRNSNTMAIAPTATISNIAGVTQSIEPTYKHLFAKSNLSGEFTVINTHLVEDLKRHDMWDAEMVDDLKYFDGSILEIERIPEDIKELYPTAFEVEPEWLIECASRRQKWIDMGQSLNLYLATPSGKKLHNMYVMAWKKGLKTTYYLRSLGATQIEKSTMDINRRGIQPRWMKSKSASSEVEVRREDDREDDDDVAGTRVTKPAMPAATCNLDGDCESCQ